MDGGSPLCRVALRSIAPAMSPDHAHSHDESPLGFTGERVLPDQPEWAWCFQAHKFGYDDLLARIEPTDVVLDIGCGEGYGGAQLGRRAKQVVACDLAEEAVQHARAKYADANVRWAVCDAQALPFAEGSFDVICSLQVIEHFTDTEAHLESVARMLRPNGWHYVATPNIALMSEQEAANEYHLRDFDAADLQGALERHFAEVRLYGMFYIESSPRVRAMRAAEHDYERTQPRLERIERVLAKVPTPVRVKARPIARRLARVPLNDFNAARNAILAEDFEARAPAEGSFCLIGIARKPRR